MSDEVFKNKEVERAERLAAFVRLETTNMWVEARMQFIINLFNHFKPELEVLVKEKRIEGK